LLCSQFAHSTAERCNEKLNSTTRRLSLDTLTVHSSATLHIAMRVEHGSRLGEYEVVSPLGEGGMGAVYLAHDHRLKRDVAIKLLANPILAHDTEQHRLLQEARSAARLNHPHICTVHEVVTTDAGSFIVMERVEGRALSAAIPPGGLPADAVTRYGAQIADALAHAHERGVIHRDLKSGNVMLTPDGRVKVLDFGLAAVVHAGDEETTVEPAWGGGAAGTPAYMAPEVLGGEAATVVSDIWSLGIVLYEMSAGHRPFVGKTPAATAAAILHAPLPPLPDHVPAGVRASVQRCLARLPGERYQHAHEVRAALDIARETYTQPVERPILARGRTLRSTRRWAAAAIAIAAIAAAVAAWRIRSSESGLLVSSQRPIGAFGASYRQATLSPDGGLVAFADAGAGISQIWIKNLAQGDPVQITSGDIAASHPAWSPTNDQIVFGRRGQGLWAVPPLGGSPRRLTEFGSNPQFSDDGERLVFERNGREIWTARADGSDARKVDGVPVPWYGVRLEPAFSPDGSLIAYFMPELGPNGDLWIVPSGGGAPWRLTHDLTEAGGPIWTRDGRFVIFSSMRGGSRTLWRVPAGGGEPEPLTVGAGEDLEPALSRDGRTLVYTNVRNRNTLRALNPSTGAERVILERRRQMIFPRVSPDGSKLAFFGFADEGDTQIFVASMDGGTVQQLTRGKGRVNTMPRWSPDGSLLYYYEQRPGTSFRSVPVGGGASTEVRPWMWENHTFAEISPDGSSIVYFRQAAPGDAPIAPQTVIENVASREERTLPVPLVTPRWSRDGRAILGYIDGRSPMVAVCPVDGGACRELAPGHRAVWAPNASAIYFLRDTANPAVKELWSMKPDGTDPRKLYDRIGPFRGIDVIVDVSRSGEVVWSEFVEGRHELWQADLRR
jgi:eukaryotic-like serine/threonine-protein kinase